MSVLNVRGLDGDLMAKAKAKAALRGLSLRGWVVEVLTAAVGGTAPAAGQVAAPRLVKTPAAVGRIVTEVREVVSTAQRPAHDPQNCRVYRCGLCAGAGQHDPIRGL
jgi:plasmid stability protein